MILPNKIFELTNIKRMMLVLFLMTTHVVTFGQQIRFENDSYDFGQLCKDTSISKHTVILRFKNTGTDSLFLSSQPTTSSSADLAYIYDDKLKYAPNEEGIIVYQFDTKSPRKFNGVITIQSNSKPSATIVRVKWEVLPEVICKYLGVLARYNCFNTPSIDPVLFAPPTPCDSIRNLAVKEVMKLYTP